MPCINPSAAVRAAKALMRTFGRINPVPPVLASLGRLQAWGASPMVTGDMPEDDAEKLMLALYWVEEYYQHRLSPSDLLVVLRHLTSI